MPQKSLSSTSFYSNSSLPDIPSSDQDLASELTRLAGHINAAEYRFLKLLAALIERDAWEGDSGMKTPAHWLNYYCGIDLGAAREKVRVARALQNLPQIDAAFSTGAISYSKVRAMTRCATLENEAELLNIARYGTAEHMEKLVRQQRRVERLNRQGQTRHQAREFGWFFDDDGMLVINGRFAPEEGAVIVKALEATIEAMRNSKDSVARSTGCCTPEVPTCGSTRAIDSAPDDVSAETRSHTQSESTFPQKRADAVVALAEHFLATSGDKPVSLGSPDKYQVVVHLDARRTGKARGIGADASACLEDGPALERGTFRRLLCDASLVPVSRDGHGNVLNIGRKSRAVPPAIRRALKLRDGGCRHPGCTQSRHVDAHHIEHWCDGGETSLDNLVLLCRHHHRLLHEGVFSIEKQVGEHGTVLRFVNPRGATKAPAIFPQFRRPVTSAGKLEVERISESAGLDIDSGTAVTGWQGEPLDYDLVLWNLERLRKCPKPFPGAE